MKTVNANYILYLVYNTYGFIDCGSSCGDQVALVKNICSLNIFLGNRKLIMTKLQGTFLTNSKFI